MSESRCGAFHLLNGGSFYQNPEVPVHRSLRGVDGLGNAAQRHCCSSFVLASPSELWEIVSLVHDLVLDLAGVTPGATHRAMRIGHNVLYRAHRHKRWLVLPSLS